MSVPVPITWTSSNGCVASLEPPYLHHGRATLISEAILAHGGEALAQRNAFADLEQAQQAALLEFLLTLQIEVGE